MNGAGALVIAEDRDTVLLLRRSAEVRKPGLWNLPGGHVDLDETPFEAALRELYEEAGYDAFSHDDIVVAPDEKYCAVVVYVPEEFEPTLNWESDDYAWVPFDDVAADRYDEPLYPGLADLLRNW